MNQDGRIDIAANAFQYGPHASNNQWLALLLGQGNGTFTGKRAESLSDYAADFDQQIWSGTVADLNGDGIKDAIVAESYTPNDLETPPSPYLAFLLGNADGSYGAPQRQSVAATPRDVIWGDFNHDARPDVAAILDNNTVVVFLNTSSIAGCSANPSLRTVAACVAPSAPGTMHLQANLTDNRVINAAQVYIDGASSFLTIDDVFDHVFNLAAGPHKVTVKGWDDLGAFSTTINYTVQEPSPGRCGGRWHRRRGGAGQRGRHLR